MTRNSVVTAESRLDLRRFAIKLIVGLAIPTALAVLDGRGRRGSPAL